MRHKRHGHAIEQLDTGAYGYLVTRTALLSPYIQLRLQGGQTCSMLDHCHRSYTDLWQLDQRREL